MKRNRWWMAVTVTAMVAVAVSVGAARPCAAQDQGTEAYFEPDMDYAQYVKVEKEYNVVGFGRDTHFMASLMRSRIGEGKLLIMETLFETKASEIIRSFWLPNCQDLANSTQAVFKKADLDAALEALKALDDAFQAAPYSEMTYRQLYDHKWADMSASDPVIVNVEKLEAAGMQAPWFKFKGDPKKIDGDIQALKARFGAFDLADFLYTPAGPQFDLTDIDVVQAAFHDDHIMLKNIPDVVIQRTSDGMRFRVPKPGNNPMCCSRQTRTCVTLQDKVCSMCGAYCCLISQWCS